MNEKTSNGTSGQNVPKSKFRHKSRQEQAAESKLRMEKRGEKLDKARGKLAKQKPPKRPGPVKRAGRAALGGVHGFVHGKIYEVEHENVGTEGAHRSELVGESGLRHGKRFVQKKIRQHPAKAVQRAESKYVKATVDYHFRMAAQEHPEMSGNPVSQMWRKHRLKKQYQKRAREAAKTGAASAAQKTAAATEKAGIPFYGLHALRHTNASIMLSLNTPDKYAMERGGWSSDKTMKQTYQHTMSETRKKIDANIDAYFDSIMNPKKRLRWRIKKTNITTLLSKCQKTP